MLDGWKHCMGIHAHTHTRCNNETTLSQPTNVRSMWQTVTDGDNVHHTFVDIALVVGYGTIRVEQPAPVTRECDEEWCLRHQNRHKFLDQRHGYLAPLLSLGRLVEAVSILSWYVDDVYTHMSAMNGCKQRNGLYPHTWGVRTATLRCHTHMAVLIACKQRKGRHGRLTSTLSTSPSPASRSSTLSFHLPRVMNRLSGGYGGV